MAQSMDEAVKAAWDDYEQRLEVRLAGIDGNDLIFGVPTAVEAEGPDAFVAVSRDAQRNLHAQLAMMPEIESGLGDSGLEMLELLGWTRLEREIGTVTSAEGSPLDLAQLTCATLRVVFSVPSPEFVVHDEVILDEGCPCESDAEASGVPEVPDVIETVTDRDQLVGLVGDGLTAWFGHPIEADEDGDFPVRYGSVGAFVRVEQDAPVIHFFTQAVHRVRRRAQAAIEVNLLNRDVRGVTFVLDHSTVLAKTDLVAWVFSAQVFASTLANFLQAVDALDEDLALRVGGRTCFTEAS